MNRSRYANGPLPPEAVLEHVHPVSDLIVPLANGEPRALMDVIEANAPAFERVTVHQMHTLHNRPYLSGLHGERLRHRSYFLSPVTRAHFNRGTIDLVPNHFSDMRNLLLERTTDPLVLAAAAPPDRHGYFSLGVSADYIASFIGKARFFLEANQQMPRTFGRNQIHVSQVVGWSEVDEPLVEVPPAEPKEADRRIADLIAERIRDGSCLQAGIGSIPNAVMSALTGHRNLGLHTELLSDGIIELVEAGVINGVAKSLNRTKSIGTFALGTRRLYDFLHENPSVELWPVRYVNDPRVIAQIDDFVSINATLAVDFLGQCASETIDGKYYSSSGGQADFARGAMYSKGGQGFIALHSTTRDGLTRIVPRLAAGDAVTTMKNTVDHVVTEHGVAKLRGRSIRERTQALLAIADPAHRDELTRDAHSMGYL